MSGPKRLNTPRSKATDRFSRILKEAMGNPNFDLGAVFNRLSLPGYEGDLTAPETDVQRGAVSDASNYYQNMFGVKGGFGDVTSSLGDLARGVYDPTTQGFLNRASSALSGVAGGSDIGDILSKIDAQRRLGLTRDVGDIRELLSSQGLRQSSTLADVIGRRQTESEANFGAEAARLAPQLLAARTGAAQGLADLARTTLGAREGAASAYGSLAPLPLTAAQGVFNLGEAERGISDTDLQRRYTDFLNRRASLQPILAFLAGSQDVYGPSTLSQIGGLATGAASVGLAAGGGGGGGGNNGKRGSSGGNGTAGAARYT